MFSSALLKSVLTLPYEGPPYLHFSLAFCLMNMTPVAQRDNRYNLDLHVGTSRYLQWVDEEPRSENVILYQLDSFPFDMMQLHYECRPFSETLRALDAHLRDR